MLSIGATIPGSGLSDSLIAQYRDVIAADYAYVFLERNLRVGMAALDKDYTLQQTQRDRANLVRQQAQAMLLQLSQEKNLLYQKVGSFRAVSSHLEQLERQLRSSMPQHVMDMLGQQAAFRPADISGGRTDSGHRASNPEAGQSPGATHVGDLRLPERRQPVRHLQRCGNHPRLWRLHGGGRRWPSAGFIAALVAYAFAPEAAGAGSGWPRCCWCSPSSSCPRVTVGVVDKTGGSAVKVVANVPFGVAFLGSVTSTVGHTLTGLFETAFQVIPGVGALPSELSYEKNGLMFGNRLIRGDRRRRLPGSGNFRTDLVNFIHNCTMYDLIDGTVDPGTFSSSDDVWALMASPNPARFTTLTSAGGRHRRHLPGTPTRTSTAGCRRRPASRASWPSS